MSDIKSENAFTFPAVDESNHRYLLAVKDFNNRAVACRQQNDFKGAIENYNNALRIDRGFAVLCNNRGEAWYKKGDLKSAECDYRKALELNPAFAVALYNQGKLQRENGNKQQAISDFRKALKIDPGFSQAYRILSRLLHSNAKNVAAGNKKRLLTNEGD